MPQILKIDVKKYLKIAYNKLKKIYKKKVNFKFKNI